MAPRAVYVLLVAVVAITCPLATEGAGVFDKAQDFMRQYGGENIYFTQYIQFNMRRCNKNLSQYDIYIWTKW